MISCKMSSDSLSSTTSTLSNYSSSSTASRFSSSTSEVFPLYGGESLSDDSNSEDHPETSMEELQMTRSGLYDIFVDISMELPKFETFNKPDMLRATVYTICGEIFFVHQQWRPIGAVVAHHLGKEINPTSSRWSPALQGHLIYRGQKRISGHSLMPWNSHVPPAVLCNLSFRDFICATKVRLEYSVEIFLSPGIAGAERIYKCHGFPGEPSEWNKSKYLEDVFVSHKMEQLQEYDHHLAWATVYNVLDQYRENIRWQNTYFRDYGFSF